MKKIKKKNKIKEISGKYIKFCPKCNSIDTYQDKSTMQSLGYIPTKYICNYCGFSSFNFPEIEIEEIDKLQINFKKVKTGLGNSELIDTSYGKFYVRVMWKILGPISFIVGLIYLYFISHSIENKDIDRLTALVLIIFGLMMSYISFIKSVK